MYWETSIPFSNRLYINIHKQVIYLLSVTGNHNPCLLNISLVDRNFTFLTVLHLEKLWFGSKMLTFSTIRQYIF